MAHEVFMDTSGFHALLVKADDAHAKARRFMDISARAQRRFVTTDCVSFTVMRDLHLREALTKDAHFRAAGFIPLLTG